MLQNHFAKVKQSRFTNPLDLTKFYEEFKRVQSLTFSKSFLQSDKLTLPMTVDIETLAAEISYFELTFNFIDREVQSEEELFANKKGKNLFNLLF